MSKYRIDDQSLVTAFKALANPNRLMIVRRLLSCCTPGEACLVDDCLADDSAMLGVSELSLAVDVAPSTLSHHLKELHRAGIIGMQRKGKQVQCWLNTDMVEQLAGFLSNRD